MTQSVSIDPEDIINRLGLKLAQSETSLVVAESTRDAALKEVEALKAKLIAPPEDDGDLSTQHTQGCELPSSHEDLCRALEDSRPEGVTLG